MLCSQHKPLFLCCIIMLTWSVVVTLMLIRVALGLYMKLMMQIIILIKSSGSPVTNWLATWFVRSVLIGKLNSSWRNCSALLKHELMCTLSYLWSSFIQLDSRTEYVIAALSRLQLNLLQQNLFKWLETTLRNGKTCCLFHSTNLFSELCKAGYSFIFTAFFVYSEVVLQKLKTHCDENNILRFWSS